ncbi:MAG: hypothetical protein ACI97A_001555 [Planctomycetota bacterium]|jgi:hypothetical protein
MSILAERLGRAVQGPGVPCFSSLTDCRVVAKNLQMYESRLWQAGRINCVEFWKVHLSHKPQNNSDRESQEEKRTRQWADERDAADRWIASLGQDAMPFEPVPMESHPAIRVGRFFDALIDGLANQDANAIRLGVKFVVDDPKVPFGRISKTKVARKLKRCISFISELERDQIAKRLINLLRREITPTETIHLSRLVRSFELDWVTPEVLGLPIWNKYVDHRCQILLPGFDRLCSEREPENLRQKSGRSLQEFWTENDAIGVGRVVFESVPVPERLLWAKSLFELIVSELSPLPDIERALVGSFCSVPESCKGVYEVLSFLHPDLDSQYGLRNIFWQSRYTPGDGKAPPDRQAVLAYRILGTLVDFQRAWKFTDHHGWGITPLMKQLCDLIGNRKLEKRCWQILSGHVRAR